MTKRGRILRDTNAGPGLITVDGTQYTFVLEGMWRSEIPPRTGMPVDVTFTDEGIPKMVNAVPESQLAKEQAHQALAGARQQGSALAGNIKSRFGLPMIAGELLLLIGWFFTTCLAITDNRVELTFWQLLGCLGNTRDFMTVIAGGGSASAGLLGLLAIVALAGSLLPYFWKDRRAPLGGLLPILLIVLAGLLFWHDIYHAIDSMVGNPGLNNPALARARDEAADRVQQQLQLGTGVYLSTIASLFFAATGVKKYLVAKA